MTGLTMTTCAGSPTETGPGTVAWVVVTDFQDVCRIAMLLRSRAYRVVEFTAEVRSADDQAGPVDPPGDGWCVRVRLAGPVDLALLVNRLSRLPGVVQVDRAVDRATTASEPQID